MAERVKAVSAEVGIPIIFKASFDKANRTAGTSFRGPGFEAGLEILREVKKEHGMLICTDVHTEEQVRLLGTPKWQGIVNVVQIPAFLCRQTDLLLVAGQLAKGNPDIVISIKKGQFASANTMQHAAAKVRSEAGADTSVLLTDRGNMFGYGDLVVDMRNLVLMRGERNLVVMDCTHAVQQPNTGSSTGGVRSMVPTVARGAVATGVRGLFFEVHDDPDNAKSDGPNSFPVQRFADLLRELAAIAAATRGLETDPYGLAPSKKRSR